MKGKKIITIVEIMLITVWISHVVLGQKVYLPLVQKPFDPANATAGDLYTTDSIVGRLRYVPAGTFIQGTPMSEAGRNSDETQFTHTLTKNLAVMETEVTRQMWADLKAAPGSTLPEDPSYTGYGAGMRNSVQNVDWSVTLLFANLLSLQQGLRPAYWADAAFTVPVDATNYTWTYLYCDWGVTGYRLPSEGEWEYFARAGTTGPFSVVEPAYNDYTKNSCDGSVLPALAGVAWYCANWGGVMHEAGAKSANPWNLKDVHGNMFEWVWDSYAPYPTGSVVDYRGVGPGAKWPRGGSWAYGPALMRSGERRDTCEGGWCGLYSYAVGFRLVRSVN